MATYHGDFYLIVKIDGSEVKIKKPGQPDADALWVPVDDIEENSK